MRVFFGALVLNCMLSFDEIEASGLRRISTRPYENDREGVDHLVTSRRPKQSSSTYNNPPSLAHHALDLGGYQSDSSSLPHLDLNLGGYQHNSPQSHEYLPYPPESFHPLDPAEVSHVVKKYNFKNGRLPEPDQRHLPEWMTMNNQIHHPQLVDSQENSEQQNIEWLLHQYYQSPHYIPTGYPKYEKSDELELKLSIQAESTREREAELLRKKLVQKERQKKLDASRKQKAIAALEASEASTRNLHATTEIKRRGKGKAASRKHVSDSRFKAEAAGLQSQSSEHNFEDPYSVSIPGHISGWNPYVELPENYHNHLPNHQNQWNHPEGSGSRSHQ